MEGIVLDTKFNLNLVINYYSEQRNNPVIDFHDFCIYIKKYAEQNVEKHPDLTRYLDNTANVITEELDELSKQHYVAVNTLAKKKVIISLSFIANYFYRKYNEILRDCSIPYPISDGLPKTIPQQSIKTRKATEYISYLIDREENQHAAVYQEDTLPIIYIIEFSETVPSMILPSSVSITTLLTTAQQKIRAVLKNEENHDYYMKKLRNTNSGKRISITNFYSNFVDNEEFKYGNFTEGDAYYLWNQTLYNIRVEFEQIEDKTLKDINTLQACLILEIYTSYLKEKMRLKQEKEAAFACLEDCFSKSPYFFSLSQILKFQDNEGKLLCERYSEEDLQNFLAEKTSEDNTEKLPPILVLKVSSGKAFFIYKKYIAQVIVKLCDDIHGTIERQLEDNWYESLYHFRKLPEMINMEAFEKRLHELVAEDSPVLHTILTAQFIPALIAEQRETSDLFANGYLPPYSELLMLYNDKIYLNAENRLPFFYRIKIVYYMCKFFAFLFSKLKGSDTTNLHNNRTETIPEKKVTEEKETKVDISKKANEIVNEMIPEGSSLDKELDKLVSQWNKMLSKEIYNELVLDVNNFIKDYLRRVTQTLSVMTFTKKIAEDLAENIINTPNMNKILDKKALKSYVTLYILKIVSNN